jgi:hypothetical protein
VQRLLQRRSADDGLHGQSVQGHSSQSQRQGTRQVNYSAEIQFENLLPSSTPKLFACA